MHYVSLCICRSGLRGISTYCTYKCVDLQRVDYCPTNNKRHGAGYYLSYFISWNFSVLRTVPHKVEYINRIWCMCNRAWYMKMTRGTNLMQQLWFMKINHNCCIKLVPLVIFINRICTLHTIPVFVQRTVKDFNFRNDCRILVLTAAKLVNC